MYPVGIDWDIRMTVTGRSYLQIFSKVQYVIIIKAILSRKLMKNIYRYRWKKSLLIKLLTIEDGSVRNLKTFHPQLSRKGCHYIEGVSKDKLCLKNTRDFTKSQRRRQRQNDVMCALCMLEGYCHAEISRLRGYGTGFKSLVFTFSKNVKIWSVHIYCMGVTSFEFSNCVLKRGASRIKLGDLILNLTPENRL